MKSYPQYKDSGVEWIGAVPEGWKTVMIKRLSPVKRGASPRPIHDPKYFDVDGEFAWVRIADVSASERYLEETTQTLSELGASLSVKRFPGDFFLSIAGTVGKPIITKIKCCIHDGFVYFPQLEINPEFLYYIFSTGLPYQGLGKWGTQLNLNTDTVGEIFIPIPKDEEKDLRKIINYLDRKAAEIDSLIANKERLIELYEEEQTAVINQAVTKGLNPDAPMKPSGINWLGDIPEEWEVWKLAHAYSGIGSGTTPPSSEGRWYGGNIPWVTTGELRENLIMETAKTINEDAIDNYPTLRLYPVGSVAIAMYGATIGRLGIFGVEATTNQACCVLPSSETFFNKFIFYWFLAFHNEVISLSSGGGQPNINQEKISSLKIATPKKEEQTAIVQYIETQCSRLDAIIEKFKKQIELLKEYRTTLISEVVTGKIDVRDEVVQ